MLLDFPDGTSRTQLGWVLVTSGRALGAVGEFLDLYWGGQVSVEAGSTSSMYGLGGDVVVSAGRSLLDRGGDIIMSSGEGSMTSSGAVSIVTADAGTSHLPAAIKARGEVIPEAGTEPGGDGRTR